MLSRIYLFCLLIIFSTYAQAQVPAIRSISPASGAPGTIVTISGANFNTNAATNIVHFGSAKAKVETASATQITAVVPINGLGTISVLNSATGLTGNYYKPFANTFNAKYLLSTADFDTTPGLPPGIDPDVYVSVVEFADLDSDGKTDMAVLVSGRLLIYRNVSSSGVIAAGSFAPSVSFKVHGTTSSLIIKDMNGDGKPEIFTDGDGGMSYCFMNKTTPGIINTDSFSDPTEWVFISSSGPSPSYVVDDINGDGFPDLVYVGTSFEQGGAFGIALNTSVKDGRLFLAPRRLYNSGKKSKRVLLGDMDNDGRQDIITLDINEQTVSIFLNKSTGTDAVFGDAIEIPVSHVYNIKLEDMDADGKTDILLFGTNGVSNTITVLRNAPVGGVIAPNSFVSSRSFALEGYSSSAGIADMNGDAKPDVIYSSLTGVNIVFNNSVSGSASFNAQTQVLPAGYDFKIAEVDGDGHPDIIGILEAFDNTKVKFTIGHRKLVNDDPLISPPFVSSLSTQTALNDSEIDVVGSGFSATPDNNIVYFGAVKAQVKAASDSKLTVVVPSGNTYQPLTVLNRTNGLIGSASVPFTSKLPAAGQIDATTFIRKGFNANSSHYYKNSTGDIDGDGKPDLVVSEASSKGIDIYLNAGKGYGDFSSFTPKGIRVKDEELAAVRLVDLDGDGKLDIFGPGYYLDSRSKAAIFLNTSTPGSVSFSDQIDIDLNYSQIVYDDLTFADLDGDGKIDIATMFNNRIQLYQNRSTPGKVSFVKMGTYLTNGATVMSAADIDGDNRPDLFTYNLNTGIMAFFRNASNRCVFFFEAGIIVNTGFPKEALEATLTAADMDNDGKLDIVLAPSYLSTVNYPPRPANKNIMIILNKSTQDNVAFGEPEFFEVGDAISSFALGDLNGDGLIDVATANHTRLKFSVVTNNSTPGKLNFSAKTDFESDKFTTISICDLDGDGKADIVTSTYNGEVRNILLYANTLKIVPVPTITAGGPLIFEPGKNVLLTAVPSTGYSYQWYKNGEAIAGANNVNFTATGTGAYTASIAYKNESQTSAAVRINLPPRDLLVSNTSVTCKGLANGSVSIVSKQTGSLTAVLSGNGVNSTQRFNASTSFNNLKPGVYNLCVSVTDHPGDPQCFTMNITEPKDLAAYSVINTNDKKIILALTGGDTYYIKINGRAVVTKDSTVTLPLSSGRNDLQINTDKPCQGVVNKVVTVADQIIPYPSPFEDVLYVNIGDKPVLQALVQIYSSMGTIVYNGKFNTPDNTIRLDVSGIKMSGLYTLKLTLDGRSTLVKVLRR